LLQRINSAERTIRPTTHTMTKSLCTLLALLLLGCSLASAQSGSQSNNSAMATVVGDKPPEPSQVIENAWSQLKDNLNSKKEDDRISAINALSLLGGNTRAEDMVRTTLDDPNIDVRLAAIVAAGQMDKDPASRFAFRQKLHNLLNDPDPQVSFTAAVTLYTAHDNAGHDILVATALGERAGSDSFWKSSQRNANHTLHSPMALAKIAATTSLSILVPPVGMGMGAYNYLKGAPGASPQVTALSKLSLEHTAEIQSVLIEATQAKNPGARIAAAEGLANFSGPAVRDALQPLMLDDKQQVRLTASAAYIRNQTMRAKPLVAAAKRS
jgi:HEAT repeat protein